MIFSIPYLSFFAKESKTKRRVVYSILNERQITVGAETTVAWREIQIDIEWFIDWCVLNKKNGKQETDRIEKEA